MTDPQPNVVPHDAAILARSFVFELRREAAIGPPEVVARLLDGGHGSEFSSDVRAKRLRTWARQVLRRLHKRGWLGAQGRDGWPPTAALRDCRDPDALSKPAPRPAPPEKRLPPPPTPPVSWVDFIQDWVFHHRQSEFGVAQVTVAVVQGGHGTGDIDARLDGAREIVERELRALERDGLLRYDDRSETFCPTELLREWPTAEGG